MAGNNSIQFSALQHRAR